MLTRDRTNMAARSVPADCEGPEWGFQAESGPSSPYRPGLETSSSGIRSGQIRTRRCSAIRLLSSRAWKASLPRFAR